MKFRNILCLVLAALFLIPCLAGCQSAAEPPSTDTGRAWDAESERASAALLSAVVNAKELGFSAFDNQLVEYLKETGLGGKNFTVSPLSFKAALTLAALGAEGETRDQLLKALGFQDLDELRAWYATVLAGVDDFDATLASLKENSEEFSDDPAAGRRNAAYRVVNSVWSNRDLPGEFRGDFLADIAKTCRAEADSAKAADLAGAVNKWINEKTDGLIPGLLDDVSGVSAILANAVYLKSGWEGGFAKRGDLDFETAAGEKVQKPFMSQRADLLYYKDEETQLVSVPLQGGVSMVFVLGDDAGLSGKLGKAETRLVDVTVPMFDVETTLNQKELVDYLRLMGCDRMFSDTEAEFGPLYTEPLYVADVVQKAKVHIDEEGLEAAAVTVMLMEAMAAEPEPETPEIFTADRPFSFYVLKDGESPEMLFWGQIVE